jgi:sugar/nucleoside kinase (ribokinase family)
MGQLIIFSEGLIELHLGDTGGPGISGDGIAMAVAASFLNKSLAEVTGRNPVEVSMLSAAGDDPDGHKIRNFCEANEIGTKWFVLMPLLPDEAGELTLGGTASWEFVVNPYSVKKVGNIYHNRDSENCPIDRLFQDAIGEITGIVGNIDKETVLVVSGIAASRPFREQTFDTMLNLIREVRVRGAIVIVDPNTRPRLFKSRDYPEGDPDFARNRLLRLFSLADIVAPSFPDDLRPQGCPIFPWVTPDETCKGLFALGVRDVIVKLGDSGSIWFRRDGTRLQVPSERVNNPNTSGAGDAYMGGLSLALAFGLPIDPAMRLGTLAAVQMIQRHDRAIMSPELTPSAEQIAKAITFG